MQQALAPAALFGQHAVGDLRGLEQAGRGHADRLGLGRQAALAAEDEQDLVLGGIVDGQRVLLDEGLALAARLPEDVAGLLDRVVAALLE
ncbi:MAG: hypothetical protein ACK559_42195, partial [bacterium]